MIDVLIAPIACCKLLVFIFFGIQALILLLVTVASALAFEWVAQKNNEKRKTLFGTVVLL